MNFKNYFLITSLIILSSCNSGSFFENKHTTLENIFHLKDQSYYVYFYSNYCSECKDVTNTIKSLKLDNLYYVNLDKVDSNSYDKMIIVYSPIENDIEKYINVTKLEELVFYSAPCIYYFENKNNKSTMTNIYSNKDAIIQLTLTWGC